LSASDPAFRHRYGPWALVAGASDGLGTAFARAMAARGLHVVLLARRGALLDEVAADIRSDFGAETRTVVLDLARPDAARRMIEATADVEIGMFMYCAGADPSPRPFLTTPVEECLGMVHRNCDVLLETTHHYAAAMVERGRGGVVIVGSGAGFHGAPEMVTYSATKAFDILFAESLWAELHSTGVDVLSLVIGATDTPALRKVMFERGVLPAPDGTDPIPGVTSAEDTVDDALAHLTEGPSRLVGQRMQQRVAMLGALDRNDAVHVMIENAGGITKRPDPT
jgi:short-subunit dehydrogenase